MQKYNIIKILATIVIGIGIIVIIGWIFDIQVLKNLSPSFVTMKLSTAISFVMSGMIIYLINEIKHKDSSFAKILFLAPIIIIIFFMITLFISNIFGVRTGIEDIFIKETETIKSVTGGRPSIGTMVSFILIIILSLAFIINPQKNKLFFIIGNIIAAISSLSLIGYATDLSFLYYEIEKTSTAMALHTSIAFVVAATSIILLSKPTLIQQHSRKLISIRRKIAIIIFTGSLPVIIFTTIIEYNDHTDIVFALPALIAITAFAVISTMFISKLIITPIKDLTNAIAKFQVLDIVQNIEQETKSNDEVEELLKSFEHMKQRIDESRSAMKQSELKFRQLYENSPDLLRTINIDGIIIDCNKKYAQYLGYTKDEILGKSIFEHVAQESITALRNSLETWKKTSIVSNREMVFKRKDGTKFPVLLSATGLYDERNTLIGSNTIIRDTSELKDAQKQIQELQSKKFSVIGELAARLAHDLRNPLTIIKNTVEILNTRHMYESSEQDKSDIARLDRAITRMVHQIEHVMDFVRVKPLEITETNLIEIVESAIYSIPVPSEITINYPKTDIKFFCDPIQLEIVFINLLVNAIQAMEDKGKIFIKFKEEQNFVIIEVEDTGPAIPEDIIPYIFEPLVTTKMVGTGLGLATCKTIIEEHNGTIKVKNNPVSFIITLPK